MTVLLAGLVVKPAPSVPAAFGAFCPRATDGGREERVAGRPSRHVDGGRFYPTILSNRGWLISSPGRVSVAQLLLLAPVPGAFALRALLVSGGQDWE